MLALAVQTERRYSRLDKDLHTTPQTKNQVKRRLLLDVIIRQGPPIFELFPSEDETLLIRRNALFILDLRLHVIDGIRGLHLQSDRFPSETKDYGDFPLAQRKTYAGCNGVELTS